MLKYWPFKKQYLLVTVTILLLLISYYFSFRHTINAWQLKARLQEQLAETGNLSLQPGYLIRKNNNLKEIIKLYHADTTNFRNNIINTIAILAEKNDVKLIEVPVQSALFHTDKYIIQQLNFEGGFFNLNKFLDQLQTSKNIGKPRSVIFRMETVRNSATPSSRLVMQVYLEVVI